MTDLTLACRTQGTSVVVAEVWSRLHEQIEDFTLAVHSLPESLKREGLVVNTKQFCMLSKVSGLQLGNKAPCGA